MSLKVTYKNVKREYRLPSGFVSDKTYFEPPTLSLKDHMLYLEKSPLFPIDKKAVSVHSLTLDLEKRKAIVSCTIAWEIVRMVHDLPFNACDFGADWGLVNFLTIATERDTFVIPSPFYASMAEHDAYLFTHFNDLKAKNRALKKARRYVIRAFKVFLEECRPECITFETLKFHKMPPSRDLELGKALYKQVFPVITGLMRAYNVQITYAPHSFPSSNICSSCHKVTEIKDSRTFKCAHCGLELDRDVNAAKVLRLWGYYVRHAGSLPEIGAWSGGIIYGPYECVAWCPYDDTKQRLALRRKNHDLL